MLDGAQPDDSGKGEKMPRPRVDVEALKRLYDSRKGSTERSNCERHWQEVAEIISPRKIDFVGTRTPGEKKMNTVLDSTGIHSNEMLASGLHGMATNPASRWFSLRMVTTKVTKDDGTSVAINEDKAVLTYLSEVEEVMWQRMYQPGTNFTTALHESYLDLGAFGTAVMFIGTRANGGLLIESRPLAECVIAENSDGKVDSVMRKTQMTVRQVVQMGQSDGWKVSDRVMDLHRNNKCDEMVTIIHAVYPRADREPGKKNRINKAFASVYFEHDTCNLLEEDGYDEFPYMVPRWAKYAGEVYGRSPAMTALPDVKMLQAMSISVLKAAQKIVDPPMFLRDDGVSGPVRTVPGGINYWRGNPGEGVMLMPTAGQALPITLEMLESLRNRIRTTFFVDVLQFTMDAKMTATEVMQRTQERMRLLGPLIGRLEGELLGPLIERVFGILNRERKLPVPPEVIQDSEFTVEYVSPIATAQKQNAAMGIGQVFQILAPFGPEVGAQIASKELDITKLFVWAWDLFNCDPKLLKQDEDREVETQKASAAEALQMGAPAMDMVSKGAGAVKQLGDAQAGGGIDLQSLMRELSKNPQIMQQLQDLSSQQGGGQRTLPPPGPPDPSMMEQAPA